MPLVLPWQGDADLVSIIKDRFRTIAADFREPQGKPTPNCPWSDHDITIDGVVSYAQMESVLTQFTIPFLPSNKLRDMFDFYMCHAVLWLLPYCGCVPLVIISNELMC
jgi:hypothetical protein